MKREILFRGKLKKSNKFIYGLPTYDFRYIFNSSQVDSCDNYEVIPETVCQFTGLTDKNGTKAFDKDLIKAPSGIIYAIIWATWVHDEYRNKFLTDRYEFTGWCISKDGVNPCDLLDSEVMSGEIIGNLIDSPELLK